MNNERMDYLLAYLNGLTKLANSEVGYTCTREIGECVGWIREEFEKDASVSVEVTLDGRAVGRIISDGVSPTVLLRNGADNV